MHKHKIHVNGIDIVYEECGSKNEIVLVLLHGFCGSSHYWKKTCETLSEQYRVLIPDLRGHGESSSPEGTYSMELMADDIAEMLEALHIEKVVMFGHSLGGYVTAAFAEKYQDKLAGLALIHSTVLPDSDEVKEKRIKDITAIREKGITPYVCDIMPGLFNESKLKEMQVEVAEMIAVGQKMNPEVAISIIEGMMERPDRSHVLINTKFPILLVAGAEDGVISPEDSFSITNLDGEDKTYKYPHILETTFENVGHMSLFEIANQLSRVMVIYLQNLQEREKLRCDTNSDESERE